MSEFQTRPGPGGFRPQGGTPGRAPGSGLAAQGLILRGVVTAVYVADSASPAFAGLPYPREAGVYVDVTVFSTNPRFRGSRFLFVPVRQDIGAGLHNGTLQKPRAASKTFSGKPITGVTDDPLDLDGDVVLVEFLDGSMACPIVTGSMQHPRRGSGDKETDALGVRTHLRVVDGDPHYVKHHGSYFGVDTNGNFVLDTRRAHGGETDASGKEVPANDTGHGNVDVVVGGGNTVTVRGVTPDGDELFRAALADNSVVVRLRDGASLTLSGKEGETVMTVGGGAKHLAVAEELSTLYAALKTALETYSPHVHPSAMGPTGPAAPTLIVPAWAEAILSSAALVPG